MSFHITLKSRSPKPSKRFPLTLALSQASPTVADLKLAIEASALRLNRHRQRITTVEKKQVLDDDDKKLQGFGVKDGDDLHIKDLGPQVAWKTVFLTEYFGPLFIHPAFYFGSRLIYGKDFVHSKMQTIALVLILIHYAKRELETLFVHRFSSATMPILNIFKNSAHYWGLSGVLLAVPLYGPWNGQSRLSNSILSNDKYLYFWVALWAYSEFSNLLTHLNLASLRPSGTKTRQIPRGYGFDSVSCANYWFESLAWFAFTGLTLNWAAGLFTAVAVGQMYVWAVKKHRRYRKEFGDKYPRGRKAMFPFIA
ncbi:trans-2-enoyl-CoA reductase (NADPH) TSC13 [Sporobolomyces salmoneus]|uniref:trans-2-enoyl-CoA reductase (NADPH) TSC13 n=1 Tax=Sporobolomyces salmoneus TaxID=183962 RepID=UPI0031797FE5